ncbi:hypothetical protein BD289DRAFT_430429 [Coniella lustricola]|uniref:Uncharacterized protein n=1 Tax=Coniella lustricola TaxID=2025994 RepID=A0A2T3AC08_9PEZI|nr:hypothetical protein BD289DRAFT_430429 [Coniella lustricola]
MSAFKLPKNLWALFLGLINRVSQCQPQAIPAQQTPVVAHLQHYHVLQAALAVANASLLLAVTKYWLTRVFPDSRSAELVWPS